MLKTLMVSGKKFSFDYLEPAKREETNLNEFMAKDQYPAALCIILSALYDERPGLEVITDVVAE